MALDKKQLCVTGYTICQIFFCEFLAQIYLDGTPNDKTFYNLRTPQKSKLTGVKGKRLSKGGSREDIELMRERGVTNLRTIKKFKLKPFIKVSKCTLPRNRANN